MINSVTKTLSKSIIERIKIDEIIYAEVTPPGAMGNSGGIIFYIILKESQELVCYETSIYNDSETYLFAEKKLFRHLDRGNSKSVDKKLYFDFYYGGMGNNVLINKKAILTIQDNFFIYKIDNLQFQIFSSVQGVFNAVAHQLLKMEGNNL